ncbi:membrane hypothetical protein [Verrucomicrobia bacterium]|nr:membrane hypothetical protein [Verrucomicrobiota bacterium]
MRTKIFAIVTAVVFFVSAVFPLVAAFVRDTQSWPKWWGTLDVGSAFVLAGLVLATQALARERVNQGTERVTYRTYRVLIHLIFVGLVVFFLAGDRIAWSQCLTGLLWRAWLLLYALPWWLAAFGTDHSTDGPKL